MTEKKQVLPTDPKDYAGVMNGFDCVCHTCGAVFRSDTPDSICGRCDYLNDLDDEDDE